jgi:hypothetical protein
MVCSYRLFDGWRSALSLMVLGLISELNNALRRDPRTKVRTRGIIPTSMVWAWSGIGGSPDSIRAGGGLYTARDAFRFHRALRPNHQPIAPVRARLGA